MKVIPFQVPKTRHEAFRLQIEALPYFYDRLHQHVENQIMLIEKGEGTLIAGDFVGRFAANDVYLLASGQPHVFRNDEQYYRNRNPKNAKAIALYFDERYAGESFWSLSELKEIRQFILKAGAIRVEGKTKIEVSLLIRQITQAQKASKLILFLQLLNVLAQSKNLKQLSIASVQASVPKEEKRMNNVLQFTFKQSHRKIKIKEVASIANLSAEAFCRYFKTRTRKTYTNFLNEVRISNACKMLFENTTNIQIVCYQAGFKNLSHFNRVFKKVTGKTPTQYLQVRSQ